MKLSKFSIQEKQRFGSRSIMTFLIVLVLNCDSILAMIRISHSFKMLYCNLFVALLPMQNSLAKKLPSRIPHYLFCIKKTSKFESICYNLEDKTTLKKTKKTAN